MKTSACIFCVLALAGAASCAKPEAREARHGATRVTVALAAAHEEPLAVIYRASGTVRGRNTTVLTSKTTGYVREVHVSAGDRVAAGQPLIHLEANDVRATVARARAALDESKVAKAEAESSLEAARAAAKIAKVSFDRAAYLLKESAIPQQQFDEAEARWKSAEAQEHAAAARVRAFGSGIDEARAGLGEASATLGYADITAPFAGRVIERKVDPGALAAPGTPLLVIADEGTFRVEVPVEESHANEVHVGDLADVEIETLAQKLTGRVGEVVPNVDVSSRAFLVKIDLPQEPDGLRSGTFARVGFHVGTRPRLVVPTSAVTSFGALDRVFVADAGLARLRMVTLGDTQGAWTEVLSGLSPDEKVVASPTADLRDGTPIEVKP